MARHGCEQRFTPAWRLRDPATLTRRLSPPADTPTACVSPCCRCTLHTPPRQRFHRILLSWDYFALCQRQAQGKGVYDSLRRVPNTFASIQVWGGWVGADGSSSAQALAHHGHHTGCGTPVAHCGLATATFTRLPVPRSLLLDTTPHAALH
jgi:hypothetical protein